MSATTRPRPEPEVRICFVCLGNICRSPTAEAVMRALLAEAGLDDRVAVESAGTGSWHVGEPADRRARAEAERRGIALDGRGRQFRADDFDRCDLVVAMDAANEADLRRLAPDPAASTRVRRLREFDPAASPGDLDVPDPYLEGGFPHVFDLVDAACRGLLDHVRSEVLDRG